MHHITGTQYILVKRRKSGRKKKGRREGIQNIVKFSGYLKDGVFFKTCPLALTGWLSWSECHPAHQNVAGLIPI